MAWVMCLEDHESAWAAEATIKKMTKDHTYVPILRPLDTTEVSTNLDAVLRVIKETNYHSLTCALLLLQNMVESLF